MVEKTAADIERGWYYCLKHHCVEPYLACRAADRLGPYATRDEADTALAKVKARNEAWDAQDEQADDE